MTLTEFVLARIADDERWARKALAPDERKGDIDPRVVALIELMAVKMLADCEAKRRIVESARSNTEAWEAGQTAFLPDDTACVRILAAMYADRPDFDKAWA